MPPSMNPSPQTLATVKHEIQQNFKKIIFVKQIQVLYKHYLKTKKTEQIVNQQIQRYKIM